MKFLLHWAQRVLFLQVTQKLFTPIWFLRLSGWKVLLFAKGEWRDVFNINGMKEIYKRKIQTADWKYTSRNRHRAEHIWESVWILRSQQQTKVMFNFLSCKPFVKVIYEHMFCSCQNQYPRLSYPSNILWLMPRSPFVAIYGTNLETKKNEIDYR